MIVEDNECGQTMGVVTNMASVLGSHSRPNLQNVVQKGGKGDKSMFQKNEDFLAFWLKIDIRLA